MRTLKQVATNMADAFTRFGLWKGGGGSSLNAEITELWSGQQSTSGTLTLLDDYSNYDIIISMTEPIVDVTWQQKFDFMLNSEKSLTGGMAANGEYIALYSLTNWSGTSVHFNVLNNPPRDWNLTLRKIWGIKFISQQHEYSTEEKVVGKWIDGKPIYEISYYNKTPVLSSTYNDFVSTGIILNNIDNIININATVIRDYGGKLCYPIVYEDNNYKLIVRPHDINNSGNYNIEYCAFFSTNNIKNLIITIQYTKTTD